MVPTDPIVSRGDADLDARYFRRCLSMFATGVAVITAQSGDRRAGVTANSFSSLSLDPPLILWSINRSTRNFPIFRDAAHFAVNILAANQIEISQCFSSSEPDRFAHAKWRPGADGAPLLEGVVAHFECSTEAQYDGGDHMIIIGRVRRFSQFEGAGLLFAQGRYGIAEDHPDVRRRRQAASNQPGDIMRDSPTMRLLFYALHYMHAEFEQSHLAEALTIPQIRVLNGLYDEPRLTVEQLSERMYLGQRDAEDAIGELVESGNVLRVAGGLLELTPTGRARREAISRRIGEFEQAFLVDIPESEIAAGRRFLERVIAKVQRRDEFVAGPIS
jgi:flavin reductase (DIM6/NTAB) family NADH-FMN oxidoreductase RutF/DNA-binding MarR family transcriptional regulator